jgi:hemerythrin
LPAKWVLDQRSADEVFNVSAKCFRLKSKLTFQRYKSIPWEEANNKQSSQDNGRFWRWKTVMRIQWDDRLLTGNSTIDGQHRELFRKINLLIEACHRGEAREAIEEAIGFLERHIVEHFEAEEKLLQEYNFPDYEAHAQEHREFRSHIARLKKMFDTQGSDYSLVIDTITTLVEWTGFHIHGRDKVFCRYLQEQDEFK